MNNTYRQFKWSSQTKFVDGDWFDFDLTETIFENRIFRNFTFHGCVFNKSKLDQAGFFNCNFVDCIFDKVSFKNVAIGAEGGLYSKCKFLNCDFKGRGFSYPHFQECLFSKCKLVNVNFNDSSFNNTKFIGKLEDVSFNGIYHKGDTKYKVLEHVDFSEAEFGEFVNFYDCDLSTCIPPQGTTFDKLLYQIYSNDPNVLSTGSEDRIVLARK